MKDWKTISNNICEIWRIPFEYIQYYLLSSSTIQFEKIWTTQCTFVELYKYFLQIFRFTNRMNIITIQLVQNWNLTLALFVWFSVIVYVGCYVSNSTSKYLRVFFANVSLGTNLWPQDDKIYAENEPLKFCSGTHEILTVSDAQSRFYIRRDVLTFDFRQ